VHFVGSYYICFNMSHHHHRHLIYCSFTVSLLCMLYHKTFQTVSHHIFYLYVFYCTNFIIILTLSLHCHVFFSFCVVFFIILCCPHGLLVSHVNCLLPWILSLKGRTSQSYWLLHVFTLRASMTCHCQNINFLWSLHCMFWQNGWTPHAACTKFVWICIS
jgi:hypothetical protein